MSNRRSAPYTLSRFEAFTHREACHWIRGSLLSPMNPVPLPPQGETRDLRRKTASHILHVPFRWFPLLVVNAVSQSPECVSCHMTQKDKSRNADFISIARRAIRNPQRRSRCRPLSESDATLLHNPRRQPRPFFIICARRAPPPSSEPFEPGPRSGPMLPILCIHSLGNYRKIRYQRLSPFYLLQE